MADFYDLPGLKIYWELSFYFWIYPEQLIPQFVLLYSTKYTLCNALHTKELQNNTGVHGSKMIHSVLAGSSHMSCITLIPSHPTPQAAGAFSTMEGIPKSITAILETACTASIIHIWRLYFVFQNGLVPNFIGSRYLCQVKITIISTSLKIKS